MRKILFLISVFTTKTIAVRDSLKQQIDRTLRDQGYDLSGGKFSLTNDAPDNLRQTHSLAKKERISEQIAFIRNHVRPIQEKMINGRDLKVTDISPELIPVVAGSHWEMLFRWWNHVWWSVPYEKAYGRQMRYIVWDKYHEAVIGLIGLQSPILSWAPRDRYLNIPASERDYWVNQSMSAQRLGAMPPYNEILGGKLVAMLMTSDKLREDFHKKYSDKNTTLCQRKLPAHLLFITTTGAFGKSSIYTRLKLKDEWLARFIGYSNGFGSFHIPNEIYEKLLVVLSDVGVNVKRGCGNGPSRKMRLIQKGMNELGYKNGGFHGVKRAIYLFPFAKNTKEMIMDRCQAPLWHHRQETDLTDFWKNRWILPRIKVRQKRLQHFNKDQFIAKQLKEIDHL